MFSRGDRRTDESEFLPAALEIIEKPASPVGRAVAATIMAFFALAIVWATFGKVDIIATAQGRVVPAGKVKVIQPFETGIVRAIDVQDGDQVHAGDMLVQLDPTNTGADRERLANDLKQAQLDAAIYSALKRQIETGGAEAQFVAPAGVSPADIQIARAAVQAHSGEQASKLSSLDQEIAQKRAELDGVAATIDKLDATIPVLAEKEKLRLQLLDTQYGIRFAYLDAKQQSLEAQHEREVQSRKRTEVEAAQRALEQQRDQAKSQYAVDVLQKLTEAQQKAAQLTQELVKADYRTSETELRSPIDGTIQQLAVHTLGGVVTPAEQLMVIVPNDRQLLVEAMLPNRDVGFVHAGQDVELKVETFTFTRYGLLRGHVVDVSRDAVVPPASAPNARSAEAANSRDDQPHVASPEYVARIRLDQTKIMVDGQEQELGPGMAITAEIKTGKRTIMNYLLSPLTQQTQESLHER
jgi:hemolysin D